MPTPALSRREFVGGVAAALASTSLLGDPQLAFGDPQLAFGDDPAAAPGQATGTRVGEVTSHSAIVWTRLTTNQTRNNEGRSFGQQRGQNASPKIEATDNADTFEGACPGSSGRVRLRYGTREDFSNATTTDWFTVTAADDFIHKFHLSNLQPVSRYYYVAEAIGTNDSAANSFRGMFETAPVADDPDIIRFCVMTCQGYPDRGHPDGHPVYPSMQALKPQFGVLTGDLVYYDNDPPKAVSPRLARYHWERMFSLPRLVEFNRNFATYWLKDDHDTLDNDSWPGRNMGDLTFDEGQQIFRQQAPMAEDGPSYRTFRWGKNLQIWFTDGRDFRSPNKMPDGPDKTIWGDEQKAWFKRTVVESDATWKVLVSPTPLVGPDRKNKNDNHANEGFQHEGDEIRAWLQEHVSDNFFVICGDRHWQYHSAHPQTGLNEFSVGAASNEHAGGSPGENKTYHKFHRVKGGFLSVTADTNQITFHHHDVNGKEVYRFEKKVT